MPSEFELNRLCVESQEAASQCSLPQKGAVPRHQRGEKFLKGPVPWTWIEHAARLPGKALHVGIALWHLAGMKNTNTIQLSGGVLRGMGVDRFSCYRALEALEANGLISVARHPGRQPMVTICQCPQAE
jgi:hypothetical protein